MLVLIVSVTRRALSDILMVILDVMVALAGRSRSGVGTEWFTVVPAQVIDAHFHSVDARIETLGALVHICDNRRRTTIPDKKIPKRLDRLITTRTERRHNQKGVKQGSKPIKSHQN